MIHVQSAHPDEWECGDCGAWVMGGDEWCVTCNPERPVIETLKREAASAKLTQVGGEHYVKYAIQPWDIIDCYGLSFYEGSALKYLLRYRDKNGVEDLKKARHYIDKLIEVAIDEGEVPQ